MPSSFQKCIVFLIPKQIRRNLKFKRKRPDYDDDDVRTAMLTQAMLEVVAIGAGHFMISPTCVRWAVVSYADSARESITLTAHSSLQTLQPAIRALPLINGGSNLLAALQLLRTQVRCSAYCMVRQQ